MLDDNVNADGSKMAIDPAMEVKYKGDALDAEIASNDDDILAQETIEDQQEGVLESLQEPAGEAGTETIQDALLEKVQEKTEDKLKDTLTGETKAKAKGSPDSGVRVR
jgi:hypothetical protein